MENELEEKPVTLGQLKVFMQGYMIDFYNKVIAPGMERMFDQKFEEKIQPLKDEMRQGFDDLYKKYETLQTEQIVTNHHLGRIEKKVDRIDLRLGRVELRMDAVEGDVVEIKDRLAVLSRKTPEVH